MDSGVDPFPLGANPDSLATAYIGVGLTLESLGLALAPSESALEASLRVIGMVGVVRI